MSRHTRRAVARNIAMYDADPGKFCPVKAPRAGKGRAKAKAKASAKR